MRLLPALSLFLALVLAPPAMAQTAAEPAPPRRIVVVGEGRVEAAPDLATVTAGVQTEAPRAADAMRATAEAMRAVFAALEAQGVAPEDLQTSQLAVDPVWDDGGGEGRQPRVRAYSASNLVTIRVRDVARLGAVIDAVGEAGANRIFGIGFERDAARDELDQARTRAVEDARAKAEVLAAAAGVTLGSVLSIREPADEFRPGPMMARAEAMMDMPVAEGVVALEARVEVVYALE